MLLLVLGRIANALVPYQNKVVVDQLTDGVFAWEAIPLYVGLRFLQGSVRLIESLQSYLWIDVGQVQLASTWFLIDRHYCYLHAILT